MSDNSGPFSHRGFYTTHGGSVSSRGSQGSQNQPLSRRPSTQTPIQPPAPTTPLTQSLTQPQNREWTEAARGQHIRAYGPTEPKKPISIVPGEPARFRVMPTRTGVDALPDYLAQPSDLQVGVILWVIANKHDFSEHPAVVRGWWEEEVEEEDKEKKHNHPPSATSTPDNPKRTRIVVSILPYTSFNGSESITSRATGRHWAHFETWRRENYMRSYLLVAGANTRALPHCGLPLLHWNDGRGPEDGHTMYVNCCFEIAVPLDQLRIWRVAGYQPPANGITEYGLDGRGMEALEAYLAEWRPKVEEWQKMEDDKVSRMAGQWIRRGSY